MKVSNSAFYNWLKTKDISREKESLKHLKNRITAIFKQSNHIYCSRRIQKSLERENIYYCRSYISFLMKKLGLKSVLIKKYVIALWYKIPLEIEQEYLNIKNKNFVLNLLGSSPLFRTGHYCI